MDFLVPQRKYTGALREILSRAVSRARLVECLHPPRWAARDITSSVTRKLTCVTTPVGSTIPLEAPFRRGACMPLYARVIVRNWLTNCKKLWAYP